MSIPITQLQGVGAKTAAHLKRLNITTIEELLFHLPIRYEDRSHIKPIAHLTVGDNALIEGTIQASEIKSHKSGRGRSLICLFSDSSGSMMLRFFHFNQKLVASLKPGTHLRCFGEVRQGYHCLELIHPEFKQLNANEAIFVENFTAIYPTTEGLYQTTLRTLIQQAFNYLTTNEIIDYLPAEILTGHQFPTLADALQVIHYPTTEAIVKQLQEKQHIALHRLAFEELLAHHLSLRTLHQRAQHRQAPQLNNTGHFAQTLLTQLPFNLTSAQQRVHAEIAADLRQPHPMQRLLQGDVGSGKTVIAALSALQAIESGYQVAVMSPTELLSEQHKNTFVQWLSTFEISISWLTGQLTKKQRTTTLNDIVSGNSALILGTHALFQKEVEFNRLGLVIIDEQHRFGVHQRLALHDKGNQNGFYPHQLIMTATPIPRTLAMTAYANLDISVIDELPPGRTPVNTAIIPNSRREEVIERIKQVCQQGRQAYWVCPLIEESETLQLQAASETAEQLRASLSELRIGLLHGRMKAKEKEQVMADFKNQNLDLLVATTVVEVGVDVANASLMIIENAERLGLAQLHQLRGRVGRGSEQSYCLLLYQAPLSSLQKSRLAAIREIHDGFIIAQTDLELRGAGEVLGVKQAGITNLRVADLQQDKALLERIQIVGKTLLETHPDNCLQLIDRWVQQNWKYVGFTH